MISLLLYILVLVLIFGIIYYVFTNLITLPHPFNIIVQLVIALIFVLMILSLLFGAIPIAPLRL